MKDINAFRRKVAEILIKLFKEQRNSGGIDLPLLFEPTVSDVEETVLSGKTPDEELFVYITTVKKRQNDFTLIRKYR